MKREPEPRLALNNNSTDFRTQSKNGSKEVDGANLIAVVISVALQRKVSAHSSSSPWQLTPSFYYNTWSAVIHPISPLYISAVHFFEMSKVWLSFGVFQAGRGGRIGTTMLLFKPWCQTCLFCLLRSLFLSNYNSHQPVTIAWYAIVNVSASRI